MKQSWEWVREQSVQLGSFVPNDCSPATTASSCTLRSCLLTGLPHNNTEIGRSLDISFFFSFLFVVTLLFHSLTMNPIAWGKISVYYYFFLPSFALLLRIQPTPDAPSTHSNPTAGAEAAGVLG